LKKAIEYILDFFYPFFKTVMDKRTFRYAACGGMNTAFDILMFFIFYNFVLERELLHLPFVVISPHIASFLLSFLISFPTGFLLMRYIVFQDSYLKGRVQLIRYFMSVCVSIGLNYIFLKLFVDRLHFYPTPSKLIITCIVVGFSYLSQRYFSFRTHSEPSSSH
jgi:putative flippase GtrA